MPKAKLPLSASFDDWWRKLGAGEELHHIIGGHLEEHFDLVRTDEIARPN